MQTRISINANDVWLLAANKGVKLTHQETCRIRDIAAKNVKADVLPEIDKAIFAVVGARPCGNQPELFDEKGI